MRFRKTRHGMRGLFDVSGTEAGGSPERKERGREKPEEKLGGSA